MTPFAERIARLAPVAVAAALGVSYLDSFLNPTFFGDQGLRLDQAGELLVGAGHRVWLPFLQLQIHLLYRVRAPVPAFVLLPYAYSVLTLLLLGALCRAALPDRRDALVASVLVPAAFAGSFLHWMGHCLYQEVIVFPLFLALVYLHHFAPQRRGLFLILFAVAMLTREVFWLWWAVFLWLEWGRLRDAWFRTSLVLLGGIPLAWLFFTGQTPLLGRNVPAERHLFEGLAGRTVALGELVAETLLPALIGLGVTFAVLRIAHRGHQLSFRRYHLFSIVSLAAIYGYVLVFDPWHTTPGNNRLLAPLLAHVLVWGIVAWRDAGRLAGRSRVAATLLVVVAVVCVMRVQAIPRWLSSGQSRTGEAQEPARLVSAAAPRESWRRTLADVLSSVRRDDAGDVQVAFVGMSRREYLKFWVAPFLYEQRHLTAVGQPLPAADVLIVPTEMMPPGWTRRARLYVRDDIVRDLLVRQEGARNVPNR